MREPMTIPAMAPSESPSLSTPICSSLKSITPDVGVDVTVKVTPWPETVVVMMDTSVVEVDDGEELDNSVLDETGASCVVDGPGSVVLEAVELVDVVVVDGVV